VHRSNLLIFRALGDVQLHDAGLTVMVVGVAGVVVVVVLWHGVVCYTVAYLIELVWHTPLERSVLLRSLLLSHLLPW